MLHKDCPGLPTQEGCSSTGPRQPGAVTPSVGDWSVRAIQVTHHRRTSSRRVYDRRCRTGRVGRTSGLHYAAWARSRRARDQRRSWPWDGRQTRACCLGGRTMPGAADPGRERSAHPWMAEVQGYMWWTSMEPAGGVMNRLLGGWSSDSDGRSLRIAGLERRAGPRHSTAPGGVRRETPAGHGWTGLRAETHGGPGRAGSKTCCWDEWYADPDHGSDR